MTRRIPAIVLRSAPSMTNGRDRLFGRKSSSQACKNGNPFDSISFCPFGNRKGNFIDGKQPIGSSISSLLGNGSPSAVARLIVTVVIGKTINRMFRRWARSHVFIELRKIISPCLTHNDASPAVVMIAFGARIVATVTHCFPGLIFRSITESMFKHSFIIHVVRPKG